MKNLKNTKTKGNKMFSLEEIKEMIKNTPVWMKGLPINSITKRNLCLGRRTNPETKRVMTVYGLWLEDKKYDVVVENGKVA